MFNLNIKLLPYLGGSSALGFLDKSSSLGVQHIKLNRVNLIIWSKVLQCRKKKLSICTKEGKNIFFHFSADYVTDI